MESEVWSGECGVQSVECVDVWSAKCGVESGV